MRKLQEKPIVLLGCLVLFAASLGGQVGGRAQRIGRLPGLDPNQSVSLEISPPVQQPISLVYDAASAEMLLVVPTLTPAGDYQARIGWRDTFGQSRTKTLSLQIQSPPPIRSAGGPPVILINGFQAPSSLLDVILNGQCPPSQSTPRSRNTFGELENVLTASGYQVLFFDNCVECRGGSIEDCGQALGRFIRGYPTDSGPGFDQADLVGHSMGGLIARSYLAGMKPDGTFDPPDPHRVRKLALLATPNFGSYIAVNLPLVSPQLPELMSGSDFSWRLNTWNQGKDDLRGIDALGLIGNGCSYAFTDRPQAPLDNAADGLVTLMSGSLNFARGPERTRVLPYRHTDATLPLCDNNAPGLAIVDGPAHLTAMALTSFLSGTDDWRNIGTSASNDPVLIRYGAGYASYPGADRLISGAGVEWTRSEGANPSNVFHTEVLPTEATDLWFEISGMWLRLDAFIPAGTTGIYAITP